MEDLSSSMGPLVGPQGCPAGAALPTARARGSLLPNSVCALVFEQMLLLTEATATIRAQVGSFTCVVSEVSRQVGLLAKAPPTLWAGIRLLSCMDPLVNVQR